MKGLEGLPLKYILIVLVAALIIAAVVAVVTGWTDLLETQGKGVTDTMSEGASKQLCDTRESTGTCNKGTTTFNTTDEKWYCKRMFTNETRVC